MHSYGAVEPSRRLASPRRTDGLQGLLLAGVLSLLVVSVLLVGIGQTPSLPEEATPSFETLVDDVLRDQNVRMASARGHALYQTSLSRGHLLKRVSLEEKRFRHSLRRYGHADEVPAPEGSLEHKRAQLLEAARLLAADIPIDTRRRTQEADPAPLALRAIEIDPSIKFQTIVGFGGAFTEAASIQFEKLAPEAKLVVLALYFTNAGLGYTLGRVHMNSCDFSPESYSFDDVHGDFDLSHFDDNVSHDQQKMIPFILAAQAVSLNKLQVFASPWSPPAWMKVPVTPKGSSEAVQSMLNSADPRGLLPDPQVQQAWANYFVRFIAAYKASGINMWGVTVQNEPEFAAPWEACKYNASAEMEFVGNFLGPTLKGAFPDIKIFAFDHNKDALAMWTEAVFGDGSPARDYLDGMGYHWYAGGMDRRLDGTQGYNNLKRAAQAMKSADLSPKILLGTEGCNCPGIARTEEISLFRAQRIAHNLIADLNSHAQGWVDWNLILDQQGGPNHLGNFCDAPMALSRFDESLVSLQPMMFYMWHIEGFLPPGSQRVHWEWVSLESGYEPGAYKISGPSGALPGLEMTIGTCESSSRQAWVLRASGQLQVWDTIDDGYSGICVASAPDKKLGGLLVTGCDSGLQGTFAFENGRIVLADDPDSCVVPVPDVEDGEDLGVTVVPCAESADQWDVDAQDVIASGSAAGESVVYIRRSGTSRCLTVGWPFLSVVTFLVPEFVEEETGDDQRSDDDQIESEEPSSRIVVAILNESERDTELEFMVKGVGAVMSEVPGKAIQTYVLDMGDS